MKRLRHSLAEATRFLVALLPISILFPRGLSQSLLVAVVALIALSFRTRHIPRVRGAVLSAGALFFAFLVFVLLRFGKLELFQLQEIGVFWYLLALSAALLAPPDCGPSFARGLGFAGILYGLMGIVQFLGLIPTSQSSISSFIHGAAVFRSTGLLPHASSFALIGLLFLPWLGFSVANNPAGRLSPVITLSFLCVALGISTTLGRMAFLCSTLICVIYSAAILRRELSMRRVPALRMILSGLGIALAFSAFAAAFFRNSTNPTVSRLRDTVQLKGAQGERFAENLLALEILKKHPFGVGNQKIASVALKIREELPTLKHFDDEFKSWRGIHNGYLHFGVTWGVPGILLYLGLLLMPSLLSAVVLRRITLLPAILSLEFLLFSISDTVLYFETAPLLGLLAGFSVRAGALPHRGSSPAPSNPGAALIFFLAPTLMMGLGGVRSAWIQAFQPIVSVIFDNPSTTAWTVSLGGDSPRSIPAGKMRTFTRRPGAYHLQAQAEGGGGRVIQTLKLYPRDANMRHDQYIWTTDRAQHYQIKHFEVQGSRVVKLHQPFVIARSQELTPIPESVISSGATFGEDDPMNFSQRIRTLNGITAPSFPTDVLTRQGYTEDRHFSCWEPTWVILFGQWDTDLCSVNAQWNPYGKSVYLNYAKYLWSIILRSTSGGSGGQ